ncbi:ATP-binding cassette domain-containing protein [Microbacterium album]|uniref:ABC transporter domain-containing protein n=1 Tax=Microbacterium album TaxID=2053191 RepID=A0A917IGQ8_9MICO|nr:ATP-binding cassette domain-containing protein [Microbacterium album]GGH48637.1 hypothetical protein GCM10010921_26240 [Microbacterium album]
MTDGKVLEFRGVTKIFGDVAAVSDFTARVEPGAVTGFVGPNGAGKTTTLRILLGEIRPTSGTATIGGVPYSGLSRPRSEVGAVLEHPQFRPRRTAAKHLTAVARAAGVSSARVAEVLDVVGLSDVATMRIAGFSLGMRQRLGIAEALLGDPGVLVFDEPANGLDPEGIRWMRLLMRRLADEGRTVLMSSHVLAEVQQVADDVLIISNGRLLFSGGIEQLASHEGTVVAVDSPDRAGLRDALAAKGLSFELLRSGINVHGATTTEIGVLAAEAGVPLSSLQPRIQSLEDVFLKIVSGEWTGSPGEGAGEGVPAEPEAAKPEAAEPEAAEPEAAEPEADTPAETDAANAGDAGDIASEASADGASPDAETTDDAPETAPAAPVVDAAGAPVAAVDELPFVATTVDAEVATDDVRSTEVADDDPTGDSSGSTEDAPAHAAELGGPTPEIERAVAAGEAELIAASLPGEQPTPGWLPRRDEDDIPHPAAEDADDPDALETADSVIELPSGPEEDTGGEQDGPRPEPSFDALLHGSSPATGAEDGDRPSGPFAAALGEAAQAETRDALESVTVTETDAPRADDPHPDSPRHDEQERGDDDPDGHPKG